VEALHEGGATETTTTGTETAADSRTVTDTERTHLHPAAIAAPEFAEHGSEIEPSFGGEVDQRLAAGQGQPSFDAPHVETELTGPAAKKALDLALDVVGVLRPLPIFFRGESNDPTGRPGTFSEDRKGKQAHPSEELPVRGLDKVERVVSNLERPDSARDRGKVRVNDHGNQILDSWGDLNLGKGGAQGVVPF
jgi:hypothetical protein